MNTTPPVQTPAPDKPYLRRRDVIEWLTALGIDQEQFVKCVGAGLIERITLRGSSRGYYLRAAVEKHLVEPFRAAEARMERKP